MNTALSLPADLLPAVRDFGCGPTAIRKDALAKLGASSRLGSSHRQAPVKDLVGDIRAGIRDLLEVPEGWEIALGNGGATAMWAINAACLIRSRAACGVYGSFTAKCADEIDRAPTSGRGCRHSHGGRSRRPGTTDGHSRSRCLLLGP
ncbi:hypothetical protein [Nanchangia anserum]|uniref:hypothetical protein n=1 Tax=Nanchangia anserum TaxID=2692125 RepID=UPI0030B86215